MIEFEKQPEFVYIPNGRKNFACLNKYQKKVVDDMTKNITYKNCFVIFFMCTKDKKKLFGKTPNNELLQVNLKNQKLIKSHGKIQGDFGDLIVTNHKLISEHKKVLLKFKDFESRQRNDDLILNESKKITKEMLQARLLLGEYYGQDQNFGNKKGQNRFTTNDTVLHLRSPIGRYKEMIYYQVNLEDAAAKEGDSITNELSCGHGGGHSIDVREQQMFSLPYLYADKNQLNFETGIVGTHDYAKKIPSGYTISKYSEL